MKQKRKKITVSMLHPLNHLNLPQPRFPPSPPPPQTYVFLNAINDSKLFACEHGFRLIGLSEAIKYPFLGRRFFPRYESARQTVL